MHNDCIAILSGRAIVIGGFTGLGTGGAQGGVKSF